MKEATQSKKQSVRSNENLIDYRKVFEFSPEAIAIFDMKGRILDVNPRLYEWLGYQPDEVKGKHLLRLPYLTKKSKFIAMEKFLARIAGKKIEPYDLEFIAKSKQSKIGRIVGTLVRNEHNNAIQDLVMIMDVTEERRGSKRLQQFEQIFNLSDDLLCVANTEGYFTIINPAFTKILGYTMDKILSTPFIDLVHPEDKESTLEEIKRLEKGYQTINFRNRYRTKSGRYRNILWNATPKNDELFAIGRDITEIAQGQEAMMKDKEELEKMTRMMVGREMKMVELKQQLEEYKRKLKNV